MEAEEQDTTEALIKRGMGISAAPKKYQPAPPRAGENSEDEENDQDEDEDLEAPCLAPKLAPSSRPAQNEGLAQIPMKGGQTPAKDLSESELSESIPELIDLREEGEKPSPFPSQKAQCPTMLKLSVLYSSPPEGLRRDVQEAANGVCQEKVLKEQIIYIDDDMDPPPLQHLESQVDSLLIPPPSDMTPMAQKSPGRDQLSRMPERRRHSPGNTRKKTLQERRNVKSLKLKVGPVAKMCTGPVNTLHTQELVKLTSAVVPLPRLNIQNDSLLEDQKKKPEAEAPVPPQK